MSASVSSPRISVVIPVRNGASEIKRQLGALAAQDVGEEFEVVVADNGSTDGTVAAAAAWTDRLERLRVVDASGPATVAHARNVGAEEAVGEYILFCDADDRAHPGWVREMVLCLEEHDAVAGRSLVVDATGDSEPVMGELRLESVHGYLPYAPGCNCGVHREWFLELGGFDLSYVGGHEEVDFFWRLQEAGGSLGYAPGAVLDYRQRSTLRGIFRQRRRFAASSILLWARFHSHADLSPISFQGSIRHVVSAALRVRHFAQPARRGHYFSMLGWACGLVEGHLRYRILGAPPARRLMQKLDA